MRLGVARLRHEESLPGVVMIAAIRVIVLLSLWRRLRRVILMPLKRPKFIISRVILLLLMTMLVVRRALLDASLMILKKCRVIVRSLNVILRLPLRFVIVIAVYLLVVGLIHDISRRA